MDNITMWSQSADWLEIVFNIVLLVVPPLVAAAVVSYAGAGALVTMRAALRKIRPMVDEPTDQLIVSVSQKLNLSPEELSKIITQFLDALAAQQPPVEAQPLAEPPKLGSV